MNLRNIAFIEQCMRTKSEITAPKINFDETHAIMGMIDEGLDFALAATLNDLPNVIEEAGDFLWFCALFSNATNIEIEAIEPEETAIPLQVLNVIISSGKKLLAYPTVDRDEQLEKIRVAAGKFLWLMLSLIVVNNQDDFESAQKRCEETVIKKLKVRYPDKFQSRLALTRDLDSEREVLENATKH